MTYSDKAMDKLREYAAFLLKHAMQDDAMMAQCFAENGEAMGITPEIMDEITSPPYTHTVVRQMYQVYGFANIPGRTYYSGYREFVTRWEGGHLYEMLRGDRLDAFAERGTVPADEMAVKMGEETVRRARAHGAWVCSVATVCEWLDVYSPLSGVTVFRACPKRRCGQHRWDYQSRTTRTCTDCGFTRL